MWQHPLSDRFVVTREIDLRDGSLVVGIGPQRFVRAGNTHAEHARARLRGDAFKGHGRTAPGEMPLRNCRAPPGFGTTGSNPYRVQDEAHMHSSGLPTLRSS